ncbi:MAG TPA: glycosyltransferase family 4 protein, partial [Candidatus Paceibacterota bacterium]|nr:glycosyltransferase family 4 protein [Candidatus Paceibacterota bacterium]
MRLLIATPLYPPEPGGPATYAQVLEETLPKEGIEVTLAKFRDVRGLPKIIRHIAYFFMLCSKGKHADALLALDPVSTGLPAALAARVLNKPFFVKVVGDYAWEQGTQRFGVQGTLDEFTSERQLPFMVRMLLDIERWVALRAKKIIVPSNYLKSVVMRWRIHSEKIVVIHNAVSITDIGTVPDAVAALPHPVIVSVGRLVPWKGMKGLIDAVEKIRETVPVSLVIVGSGPEQEALTRLAHKKLGGAGFVLGELPHADALAVMQAADVFALNTAYEGLSHLLIEALALGLPIITTPVGGNTELITHGKNGML